MKARTAWIWPLVAALLIGWVGVSLAQNSSGGAFVPGNDYIVSGQWTWRIGLTPWVIEGATEDTFETRITFAEPTADRTYTIPNATSGAFVFSTLTTNAGDIVNSIWGVSNGLVFEGATADAFEITIAPANVTADVTLTLPLSGAAAASFMISALTTNSVNVANSIWGISNALAFGGATGADGFEIQLTPADVGADRVVTIPDMGAASALVASTLTTNATDAANSVWATSNNMVFEGLTADAYETLFTPVDPTVGDTTISLPNTAGIGVSMFFSTLTTNTIDAANAIWGVSNGLVFEGATGGADAFETTLTVTDPTGDATITLPNQTGTVLLSGATANNGVIGFTRQTAAIAGATQAIALTATSVSITCAAAADVATITGGVAGTRIRIENFHSDCTLTDDETPTEANAIE